MTSWRFDAASPSLSSVRFIAHCFCGRGAVTPKLLLYLFGRALRLGFTSPYTCILRHSLNYHANNHIPWYLPNPRPKNPSQSSLRTSHENIRSAMLSHRHRRRGCKIITVSDAPVRASILCPRSHILLHSDRCHSPVLPIFCVIFHRLTRIYCYELVLASLILRYSPNLSVASTSARSHLPSIKHFISDTCRGAEPFIFLTL